MENIAVRSLQVWYIGLGAEKITTFEPKVVKTSARDAKIYKNLQIPHRYIFLILQHFATKLCNFTNSV